MNPFQERQFSSAYDCCIYRCRSTCVIWFIYFLSLLSVTFDPASWVRLHRRRIFSKYWMLIKSENKNKNPRQIAARISLWILKSYGPNFVIIGILVDQHSLQWWSMSAQFLTSSNQFTLAISMKSPASFPLASSSSSSSNSSSKETLSWKQNGGENKKWIPSCNKEAKHWKED